MTQIRLVCGLSCSNAQKEQTNLSIGLRITAIVVGILMALLGALILFNVPGLSHIGTTAGWVFSSVGIVFVGVGISIKLIDRKPPEEITTHQKNPADLREPSFILQQPKIQINNNTPSPINPPPPEIPLVPTQIPVSHNPTLTKAKKILAEVSPEMRHSYFMNAFGYSAGDLNLRKLRELTDQEGIQVLSELSQYFFTPHWEALTDPQFLAIDHTKILNGRLILSFLCHKELNSRLSLLLEQKPASFYAFCEFFSADVWIKFREFKQKAGDVQGEWIRTLDFSLLNKKAFDKFYPFILEDLSNILPTFGADAEGLKKIRDLKKHWGIDHEFPGNWWYFLSEEQAIAVAKHFEHFTQDLTDEEKKLVFYYLFGHRDQKDQENLKARAGRLALLGANPEGLKIIYRFRDFFSIAHWGGLSVEQQKALWFGASQLDEQQKKKLFDELFGGFFKEGLKNLNDEDIVTIAKSFWEIKAQYPKKGIERICNAFRDGRSDIIKEQLNTIFQS